MVESINETVSNYRLISDYHKRESTVVDFNQKISKLNAKKKVEGVVTLNNEYMPTWLGTVLAGTWLFLGGLRVVSGNNDPGSSLTLSLGEFLATLRIFDAVGSCWGSIYE